MRTMNDDSPARLAVPRRQVVVIDGAEREARASATGLEAFGLPARACEAESVVRCLQEAGAIAVVLGPHLTTIQTVDVCSDVRRHSDVCLVAFIRSPEPEHASMVLDAGADAAFAVHGAVPARLILSTIQAVQRRERLARRLSDSTVEAGPLRIDLYRKTVELHGAAVPLTATEFGILAVLAQQPGRVISASEIVREVHGYEAQESEAQDIVKVHISRLRQKLEGDAGSPSGIANVRGQGYMYLFERRHASTALDELATLDSDRGRS